MRIIVSIFLLSLCYLQDCDEGYTDIDGECYYQSDLDVLQNLIEMNEGLSDEEPLDIGNQEWSDGRLIDLGLQFHQLTSIPESIGNLSNLI